MKFIRRLILPVLCALASATVCWAQPVAATLWSTNELLTAGFASNAAIHLRTDAAGNVFLGTTLINPATSRTELAVRKYSPTGALQWAATYNHLGGSNDHALAGMELDQAGHVYLAGTAAASPGGGDWVIVKFDPSGTRLWSTNYGSPGFDSAVGLAVDGRGYVAVAGNYNNSATLRAIKLDALTGARMGAIGVSPAIGASRSATAMTLDDAGNVWVVGTSGSNCVTVRFAATGSGLVYSGYALSPAALGRATGRALALSPANDLVFVLAAVTAATPPVQQAVLCYSNTPLPTIPLFTNWNAHSALPGTFLKPVAVLPSAPSLEDPLALAVAPGGRVVTLARTDTALGPDWIVAAWNAAGDQAIETDSTLGPTGSAPLFEQLTPAALQVDSAGNLYVTGTGRESLTPAVDFATVRYAGLTSGAPLAPVWVHTYDFANAEDVAKALTLDVVGNVFLAGRSALSNGVWLSTLKVGQGPPANDLCDSARRVSAGTVAFSTFLASDTSPPVGPCDAGGRDVWFKWTAPVNGRTEIDTYGSTFDTVLAVYTGTCGALTPVPGGCNDQATAGRPAGTAQSFVAFTATAGTTYFIQVGGGGTVPATGDGRLTIFGPLPPLGTCAPGGSPAGAWRKFLVVGTGDTTAGGTWRITVPGCTDLAGLAATSIGASAATLVSNLAASINTACNPVSVRAVAASNALFLQVRGCPVNAPLFFRVGPAGTPLDQLCFVPEVAPPGVVNPVTPPTCVYNPFLVALVVMADCNANGVPDEVDIASGVSQDTNANQIPDECEGGLKILRLQEHGVLLWGVPGYTVETTLDPLATPAWQPFAIASPVFVPFTNTARYFRLQKAE